MTKGFVSQATIEQERKETRNFWIDSRDGQPGRWISGCWYPAKPESWIDRVQCRMIKETGLLPNGYQLNPVPENYAVF